MKSNSMNILKEIKIIDVHGHIGDILYPDGGELIFKTGIKFPISFLEWFLCERVLYKETSLFKTVEKLFPYWSVKSERKRNASATLENLCKSLDGTNIVKCVCAPVEPYVSYNNILAASKIEPRIIAFTSPDFTLGINNMKDKLTSDLKKGAMGIKIHPIIQEVEADSEIVLAAVEALQPYSKPVLIHAGSSSYYLPSENKTRFINYSSIERIEQLISTFPKVNFIIGHAGLDEYEKVIKIMPKYTNAYVDTSFQNPQTVKDLITAFSGERVLFASDWHYGLRKPAINVVLKACENDASLLKSVLYDNAANLLNIE